MQPEAAAQKSPGDKEKTVSAQPKPRDAIAASISRNALAPQLLELLKANDGSGFAICFSGSSGQSPE